MNTAGTRPSSGNPLRSFWMGGFEGADHCNPDGVPLDMASANGHLAQLEGDYARAAEHGIRSVRESIGWRLCEPAPGVYDLRRPLWMAQCARRHGLQILWTVMHYGTPADLSLRDDALIDRFARFAAAVAQALADAGQEPPVYTLVNEINFLAWAASHTNLIGPYRCDPAETGEGQQRGGYDIKCRLVRATLAATHAVREVDPRARFLQVEPLVHVATPQGQAHLAERAAEVAGYQWQTWDMLAGHCEPQLGGSAAMLDLLGVNHYHSGQWEVQTESRLFWHARDPRRRPLDALLGDAWQRYRRPLVVAETSHVGAGRAAWLGDVAHEVARARAQDVPVWGLCLYPLVDRPDWNVPTHWHHSGLWDVDRGPGEAPMQRILHRPYARMLAHWRTRLPQLPPPAAARPLLLVFSRLRWGPALGRTQQLMRQLAHRYRVVFVEAPVHAPGAPCVVQSCPDPDVEVLCPHTPLPAEGFDGAQQLALLRGLLRPFLASCAREDAVVWLDTPMALPLADLVDARMRVYDCNQSARTVRGPTDTWRSREQGLLDSADLVLAAGPALLRGLRRRGIEAVHLPAAVDKTQFHPAALQAGGSQDEEARRLFSGIGMPRLGHVGTLDARLDTALLLQLADARPHWHWVLIGPAEPHVAAELAGRPNLHLLGAQPHDLLPYLLAQLQVCLLPYVCGPATEESDPPQIPEYLAAGRPVVCSPLPDVALLHGTRVRMAPGVEPFLQCCEAALREVGAVPGPGAQPAMCPPAPDAGAAMRLPTWAEQAQTVLDLLQQPEPIL